MTATANLNATCREASIKKERIRRILNNDYSDSDVSERRTSFESSRIISRVIEWSSPGCNDRVQMTKFTRVVFVKSKQKVYLKVAEYLDYATT
jgi:hypothetical protein